MIVQVIVNHNTKNVDKEYDYLVDEIYQGDIQVGVRVIVPFGKGNKLLEGYVLGIREETKKGLKKIVRVVENGAVFDEEMLELIKYMKDRYLCSYLDVIRSIVPTGIAVKPEEWLIFSGEIIPNEITGKTRKAIELIIDNGGAMEINQLVQLTGVSVKAQLKKLCEDGVLTSEFREITDVKDKTIRMVTLAVSTEEVRLGIERIEKRAPLQAKVLSILSTTDCISLTDLVQFSGGSYNVISALDKKGFIAFEDKVVSRNPLSDRVIPKTEPPSLTTEQEQVFHELKKGLESKQFNQYLLHGVTGSGKTEVYMRIIQEALSQGKTAMMLVPEISLTPQTVSRFIGRFSNRVAIFHSGLSMGERYDEWKRMRDGEIDIVIGARSAIFAPIKNLGVIILDEEHEQSYKSDMVPKYHTKEVATFRAMQKNAILIMSSATPSMESYYKARRGKYKLLEMTERVNKNAMPEVMVVDMREELANGNKSMFSQQLQDEIQKNLEKGEQTILFLNRRGFSTFVSCRSCGYVAQCPNCNISLTYHSYTNELKCHYCGYNIPNHTICPACESKYIRYFGGGTQKVEDEVKSIFPDATTIRMDVDTTGKKYSHEKILRKFEEKKIDVLIGTQMVAKGLDFANVTLVGVVSADTMLNVDDFRCGERTFSILEQVAGRAGRADKLGRAIVQTYNPEHDAIVRMQEHDYFGFYKSEIQMRHAMWYPPFCDIVSLMITGTSETLVAQASRYLRKQLAVLSTLKQKIQVLGPIPAPMPKLNNKYRWRILIKCDDAQALNSILTDAVASCYNNKNYKRISINIDKNPSNTN